MKRESSIDYYFKRDIEAFPGRDREGLKRSGGRVLPVTRLTIRGLESIKVDVKSNIACRTRWDRQQRIGSRVLLISAPIVRDGA